MGTPFIGEIRMFGGNFAPSGWAFCDGRPLAISENDALFVVLGTTYGGDGESTFNLPDLRGRVPIHRGTSPTGNTYIRGENGGVEEVTLTINQIPAHSHPLIGAVKTGQQTSVQNNMLAGSSSTFPYRASAPFGNVQMAPQMINPTGGSQPHTNLQPYLCINF
ncbi:MAG TPA: tail fiber protein, partial [Acidimicrobiales bacterium]